MNKERRKTIEGILADLRLAVADVAGLQEDEQESFDNMPESLQSSDRGQASEEAIDYLSNAQSGIEDAIENLENI